MNTYEKTRKLLFKRDGTCQLERLLPQLVVNHALIDEKALDEHLVFAYLYSDLLQYYDSENNPVDHNAWARFLEQDDTVIFSLILHTEIDQLRPHISSDFVALKHKKIINSDNKYVKRLLQVLEELLILLNYWHSHLSPDNSVRLEIESLINYELNDNLSELYNLLQDWHQQDASEVLANFCAFLDEVGQQPPWALTPGTGQEGQVVEEVIDSIQDLFDIILSGIGKLQKLAKEDYTATLQSQQHKPQLALLIAFVRLLQYASRHINAIPQRHLDFYYEEVLKFRKRLVKPDNVYVHFQLPKDLSHYNLPRGTELLAGKDSKGKDILFRTTRAVNLNQGTISRIHKIQQSISPPSKGHIFPTGSVSIATQTAAELGPANTPTKAETHTPPHHLLGLVVSSPVLYLKEGERNITLSLKFKKKSFAAFLDSIRSVTDLPTEALQEQISVLFNEALAIQFTSAQGWTTLPTSLVTTVISEAKQDTIETQLSIGPEMPAVVNFNPVIHGTTYRPQAPAIRMVLKGASHFGRIYVLRELLLERVRIEVQVSDYRDLVLQNDLGLLDSSHPFQPFGPLPQLHANFYIGSDEIFRKDVKHLQLNIEWENLPKDEGGFQQYYRSYPGRVTNEDFLVEVSYLNHRQWHPHTPQSRQKVALFELEKAVDKKCLKSHYTIDKLDLDRLDIARTHFALDPPLLTPKTLTGFLRLELCSPPMAFGHSLYPKLMSNTFVQNAKAKKRAKVAPPSDPYTPLIKSLSVDYSAKDEISFTKATQEDAYDRSFFQLAPFGYKKAFPTPTGHPVVFLADTINIGCFICFGFDHLTATSLSVHIQIDENSIDPDQDFPEPTWQYLSHNNWVDFQEDEIISDSTNGLTKPGIIVFRVPPEANTDNTLLEAGLLWFRAMFPADLATLPTLLSIHTQAVAATRVIDHCALEQPNALDPNTIQRISSPHSKVKIVNQPYPSFGGKPAENQELFYTRVSERLRHKNRAISVWDYERIILERFPDIFRVKCINHASPAQPNTPQPGKVTIVVINHLQGDKNSEELTPKVSRQRLKAIKTYLQSVTTPFVDIEVISPVYEEIKVNVEVKLKKNYEKGIFLNLLQKELRNFLSPWLFDPSEDIKLAGLIPSSKIIDFINKKAYVEGIGNFSILKYTGKGPNLTITKVRDYDNYLHATYPWSIMVSADHHKISIIEEIHPRTSFRHGGVADMSIGEDFVIGPWQEEAAKDAAAYAPQEQLQESQEAHYLVTKKQLNQFNYGDS